MRKQQLMKEKIDFENPEVFHQLEMQSYRDTLDFTDYPPVEYWYFAKLTEIYKKYRLEILSKDEANTEKRTLLEKYHAEKERHKAEEKRCKEWQENIIKSEMLKSEMCKATSLKEKYILAVQCIGALTLDEIFIRHELEAIS